MLKLCRVIVHNWDPADLANKIATGAEDWGEYQGIPGQDLQANHVELSYSAKQAARMNPPRSMLYPADQVPAYVKFYRLDLSALGLPADPATDAGFVMAWQKEIDGALGQPYAWSVIVGFGLIAPLLRIPFLGPWIASLKNPMELVNGHGAVCSLWVRKRVENVVNSYYQQLLHKPFDLFDGRIGDGQENPADFTAAVCRYLKLDGVTVLAGVA